MNTALEQLRAAIRETDYLLVIGWRGAEQHFLKLWKEVASSRDIKRIEVVLSKKENAQAVYADRLVDAGVVSGDHRSSGDGFASFVAKELHNFLP